MRPHGATLRVEELEPRLVPTGPSYYSTLPTTNNGIYLFSDQLANGLSNKLVQFIAAHFAGVQKLVNSENARYVADNPSWVLLDYRLATSSGPALYIHNGTWSSDWPSVTTHEDWFMHNPQGLRLHNSTWNWDLHDINNPAWRQYWLNSVIADARINKAQGVFADSFEAGIGSWWFNVADTRFAGTNAANPSAWPNGVTWLDQLHNLVTYMEAGLHAQPEHFLYIPNVDALVTSWAKQDFSNADGVFMEGFGTWGATYNGSASDWVLSMNRALQLSDQGKVLIMQPRLMGLPDSVVGKRQREFLIGTYLLLQGDHTYLNMLGNQGGLKANYYPEYGIHLGNALTPPASDASQYLWNGVYRRDFQKGTVLVNPTNQTITVTLDQTYQEVTGTGGGALTDNSLDASGKYIGGQLVYQAVRTVTLMPGSAAILLLSNPRLLTQVIDNGQAGYQETGSAWTTQTGGYGGNSRIHPAGQGNDTASWLASNLAALTYDVQVTWMPAATRTTQATYRIYDGATLLQTITVSQQKAPVGTLVNGTVFQSLGKFKVKNGSLRIVLSQDLNGSVDADALRLVLQ